MMSELQEVRRDLADIAQRFLVPERGAGPSKSFAALIMGAGPSARTTHQVRSLQHATNTTSEQSENFRGLTIASRLFVADLFVMLWAVSGLSQGWHIALFAVKPVEATTFMRKAHVKVLSQA